MRSVSLSLFAMAAAGCAASPDMSPVNAPLSAALQPTLIDSGVEGDVIALAFSGGGARAAAFSYGALLGLRDMRDPSGVRLVDRVAFVTSVSGGSITAAYFGQHGADGLDRFRAAALDRDWASQLHSSWLAPGNWSRVLAGGLNGRDKLGGYLDEHVFAGGRLGELRTSPLVLINATELFTGVPFAFAQPWFEAICSDAGSVLIADAVAASMAVPLGFRPTVLETYGATCPRPLDDWIAETSADRSAPVVLRETARAFQTYRKPDQMKFLHLADGGVVDNFGLATLTTLRRASTKPHAPFSARDAVRMRSLTFVVINAEMTTMDDWALTPEGPSGAEMLAIALEDSIKATKRNALDAFAGQLAVWRTEIVDWRCGLDTDAAAALGADAGWKCADLDFRIDMISFSDLGDEQHVRLGSLPTAVSLPREAIDDLISGGVQAAKENPALLSLTAAASSSRQ